MLTTKSAIWCWNRIQVQWTFEKPAVPLPTSTVWQSFQSHPAIALVLARKNCTDASYAYVDFNRSTAFFAVADLTDTDPRYKHLWFLIFEMRMIANAKLVEL